MTDYYIDLDLATSGGAGTSTGDPWNAAEAKTNLEALSGSSPNTYYFKRGSSVTGQGITITDASDFTLAAYGTGARPLFDGNYTVQYVLRIQGTATGVTIRGLHNTKAVDHAFTISATVGGDISNLTITDCEGSYSLGGSGKDGFDIQGTTLTYATGLKIKHNYSHDNDNNGFEFSYIDGAEITDNLSYNDVQNAFEYWNACINNLLARNTANECGRLLWIATQVGTHDSNEISNNSAYKCVTAGIKIGTSLGEASQATNTTIYNNILDIDYSAVSSQQTGLLSLSGNSITFKNNIVFVRQGATGFNPVIFTHDWTQLTSDNNLYRYFTNGDVTASAIFREITSTTTYSGIASWRTANPGTMDDNSAESTPLFVDYDNADLTPTASSPALYTVNPGATGLVPNDLNKDGRYSGIDLGAIQYQRHTDVTVNLSLK